MGLDALKSRQGMLLCLGLVPGILAASKIISTKLATLLLMVLFILSRKFAQSRQRNFEAAEADQAAEEEKRKALIASRRSKKGN